MDASLYLFPSLLGDNNWEEVLPKKNIESILECECFIVEELRSARRFLRKIGYNKDFDTCSFSVLNEHTQDTEVEDMLKPIQEGKNIFLMSEAGLPCIADPGAKVTALAQRKGINIVPFVGPSSIFLSLMASGFNGQNFAFIGYLPVKDGEREKALRKLEERIYRENQTQIFIEAPYRNNKLISCLTKTLKEETLLCIASNITLENQSIKTKTIREWKKEKDLDINKQNTIFLLYRQ